MLKGEFAVGNLGTERGLIARRATGKEEKYGILREIQHDREEDQRESTVGGERRHHQGPGRKKGKFGMDPGTHLGGDVFIGLERNPKGSKRWPRRPGYSLFGKGRQKV